MALALINHLPHNSAFVTAVADRDIEWSFETYMLANVVDAVNANTFALIQSNSRRRLKRPEPLKRPSSRKTTKSSAFAAMARHAHFAAQKSKEK